MRIDKEKKTKKTDRSFRTTGFKVEPLLRTGRNDNDRATRTKLLYPFPPHNKDSLEIIKAQRETLMVRQKNTSSPYTIHRARSKKESKAKKNSPIKAVSLRFSFFTRTPEQKRGEETTKKTTKDFEYKYKNKQPCSNTGQEKLVENHLAPEYLQKRREMRRNTLEAMRNLRESRRKKEKSSEDVMIRAKQYNTYIDDLKPIKKRCLINEEPNKVDRKRSHDLTNRSGRRFKTTDAKKQGTTK
ncbi:hypothetical protein H6P81_017759 [Aristolochia fimbriata]|uniref:Uncharacterized protein n=1 Tax=Aristolochia fimbriata TaxID=158543 RepID=A0AAV7DZ69_ARIFI|nr:hypothetical protein H6P81_017759 [Aristolochia fimbriata]